MEKLNTITINEAFCSYYQLEEKQISRIIPITVKVKVKYNAKVNLVNNYHQRIS